MLLLPRFLIAEFINDILVCYWNKINIFFQLDCSSKDQHDPKVHYSSFTRKQIQSLR